MKRLFADAGIPSYRLRQDDKPADCLIVEHTWPGHQAMFVGYLKQHPGVTPMRDPVRVVYSWERRERTLEGLETLWACWLELVSKYALMLLPIDHERRDFYLARVNEAFGLSLRTDWQIVPSAKDAKPYEGTLEALSDQGRELALKMRADLNGLY